MIDELQRKVKILNERVWEGRASWPAVERWLSNFRGEVFSPDQERVYALHLLSQMMYFGDRELRALLQSVYRDAYRYPIMESLRRRNGDTTDSALLNGLFRAELVKTRFLGIGNPSESGTHLLYHFRQENDLPKGLFINAHQIFSNTVDGIREIRDLSISRYVFLDDLSGSGQQARQYSRDILGELKRLRRDVTAAYYVLFATATALSDIRANTLFDDVNCVYELDESFRCFGSETRYFNKPKDGLEQSSVERMCREYGAKLVPSHPLGYRDSQLLLAFHHNTPDNTLPVIWFDDEQGPPWHPIFRRYQKKYGA